LLLVTATLHSRQIGGFLDFKGNNSKKETINYARVDSCSRINASYEKPWSILLQDTRKLS